MVNKFYKNKSTLLVILISTLAAYVLFILYLTIPYNVKAAFDPEVVEQAKDRFPDTSKSSEKSASPRPNNNTNADKTIQPQDTKSNGTNDGKGSVLSETGQNPQSWTPWLLGGGAALLVLLLGSSVWIVKKGNRESILIIPVRAIWIIRKEVRLKSFKVFVPRGSFAIICLL